ncbi:MAG: SRPBCC family protein [Pseudomonadota bacterium]
MVKKIFLGLFAAIALILIFAATRPDSFRVERSIAIKAEPAKVYALLNDFHQFANWSPWQNLDPAMKVTYSGAASGPGAVYQWEGNDAVGAGRMEILKSEPNTKVTVKLDFLQPFEGHNTSEYILSSNAGTTTVTWAMFGPSPYVSKVMGIFVSMDSMIGKDFERGLTKLKAAAEK